MTPEQAYKQWQTEGTDRADLSKACGVKSLKPAFKKLAGTEAEYAKALGRHKAARKARLTKDTGSTKKTAKPAAKKVKSTKRPVKAAAKAAAKKAAAPRKRPAKAAADSPAPAPAPVEGAGAQA